MDVLASYRTMASVGFGRVGRRSLILPLVLGLTLFGLVDTAAAQVIVLPGAQTFADQLTGTTGNLSFTVENQDGGGSQLDITGITEVGNAANCDPFVVTNTFPINIADGGSATIDVEFTPTLPALSTCTLRFDSNDTVGGQDLVAVTGQGIEPDISVDVASIDFGDQALTTTSAATVVTITNNGNTDLNVSSIALSGLDFGDFAAAPSQTPAFAIAAGGSETVSVTFSPQAIGARTASLDIVSDDPDTNFIAIPLTGNGVDPNITVDMASVDFGDVQVGATSAATTVTITNTGTTALTVSDIALSGADAARFSFTPSQTVPITIGAGANATVDVDFSPAATGAHNASLDITSDDPDPSVLAVPLTGNGIQQNIAVDMASVDFGDVVVGATSGTVVVTISNTGTATLTVNTIALSGANAGDYSFTPSQTPAFTIAAAGSETVNLDCTPSATGSRTASLDITSDDPDEATINIPLTCNGTQQDIAVDMASIDFGNQPVGTTSAATTLTISNIGTADLTITSITLAGTHAADFSATPSQTPAFTIAAGGTATVDVDFTPAAVGARTASLDIASDDPDEATVSISLTGTGTEPDIAVNPVSVSFGDQLLSTTSAPTIVTINNTGTGALTVTNVALGGTHPGDFAFVPSQTPSFTIGAGGSETVSVTFTPTAGGARAASLDITSDDPNEGTVNIPLDGNGLFPDITVDMANVDFGDVLVGNTSAPVAVTITNTGTGDLTVNNIALAGAHAADFSATPGQTAPFTIGAGGSEIVTLDFTPSATGARTASLDITSTDPDTGTLSVPLTGNGVQQDIAVDMASVSFGNQLVGAATAATTVTIQNNGTFPLLITDISLAGANAADFLSTPSQTPMFSIAAGGTETVDIVFTPGALGLRTASLQISSDDPDTSTLTVPLDGTGVEPDISVDVASLDFGQILVGDTSAPQAVTIENVGGWPLTITSATLFGGAAAEFSATPSSTLAHTLQPGETMTVDVDFTPAAPGPRNSTLQIASDDPDTATASVSVTGEGMDPPSMILSTNSLDFGSQLTGSSTDLTFDISNGMGPYRFDLNVTSITVSGDADFSVNPTSAPGIAPDGTVTITVTFVPQAAGTRMATIDVVSDDPNMGMQSVTVVGEGLEPDISVDVASHDFGPVATGFVSNAVTVTATNNGNSPLSITNAALTDGTDFSVDSGNTTATVPAAGSESWTLTCRPTTTGALNDSFVIASDDPDTPSFSVNLDCTGLDRPISIDPGASFPDTYINTTSSLNIDIVNDQDAPVTIDDITSTNSAFVVNATPPYTLNALGDRQTISVDFTPPMAMPYNGLLQMDLVVSVVEFATDGNGVVSELTVTRQPSNDSVPPTGHDFGRIDVGFSSLPQLFRLENTGTAPLTVTSVIIDDNANFNLTDPTAGGPLALTPGDQVDFEIAATPQTQGIFMGQITVTTDIPGAMYAYFGVVVEGTTGDTGVDPLMVDFGPVDVQDPNLPVVRTVTIVNRPTSNDILNIQEVRIDGNPAFSLPTLPAPTSLNIGDSIDIDVEYRPLIESAGDGANLVVVTDAATSGTVPVPLAGRGIDRHIQVSAMEVIFPETCRNPETPTTQTLIIENTGEAPLVISMLVTGGADADAFTLSDTIMSVAPQSSEELTIEFAPGAVNPMLDATLTIINDDSDRPMVDVSLRGGGILPNISLARASMDGETLTTGQGVAGLLSARDAGPMQLINLDSAKTFTVREVRVVDQNTGDLLDEFTVLGVEPGTELTPQDIMEFDIQLLSETPGVFDARVELYLGVDPEPITFVDITGRVVALELAGGCNASQAGQGGPSTGTLLLFALLLGFLAMRQRQRDWRKLVSGLLSGLLVAGAVTAVTATWASEARADTGQNLDLAVFRPFPSIESPMLSVEGAEVGESGAWSIGLAFDHATNPLTVRTDDPAFEQFGNDIPITGRTSTGLMFTYAFLNRFEGGLSLPFLRQTGNVPVFSGIDPPEGLAIGDLQAHFKVALAKVSMFSLAASTAITVPTASDNMFAGMRAPGAHVRAIAGMSAGRVRLAANAGAHIRGTNILGGASQGAGLTYGLGAEYRMSPAVSFVGELFGVLALGGGGAVSPVETAGGVRYRVTRAVSVRMGAAAGISSGIGASRWRGFFVLSFSPRSSEIKDFAKKKRLPRPDDKDGDGILDNVDECPDEAEDDDMFDDKDGCPDWDNDGDGLDDSLDKCPLRAEDKDKYQDEDGCPDNDNDGDKVADKDDKCPNEAEDMDGYQDIDGCDDPDNDSDGIPDVIDACILEPETINGNKDDDGCPDEGDPLVMVMADRLEIFEPVKFRGNSVRLTKKSVNVVNQVAATMRAQPIITKLRVAVHVHPTNGDDDALSQRRAKVIFDLMISSGITPERVEMKGFGSDQPLVPETQRGAKQINDRVEFIVLEKGI